MRTLKKIRKSAKATSLDHAIELTEEFAAQKRIPSKAMCELMGVEYKTYRRWMLEGTMPLNRLIQLERLSGCQFISEYLCIFHGSKVVIDIPKGKKIDVTDIAKLQTQLADVVTHLSRFYQNQDVAELAIEAINTSLSSLAFQRENVQKSEMPELNFGGCDE